MTARPDENSRAGSRGGIQALDSALSLLLAMSRLARPASLTDLSREARMPPSKAHRYLASYLHAGLVTQAGRSGLYALGPAAVAIGLAAMQSNDFVNRAADSLEELVAATDTTALLSVWGNGGPTVVRWQRSESFISTTLGLGTTLPLLNSATGRIFLAFLPAALTGERLRREMARARASGVAWPDLELTRAGVERLIARTTAARLASVDGRFIPGLYALAAPVLDWQGECAAAITLVGTNPAIGDVEGPLASRLDAHARSLSIEAPGLAKAALSG